MSRLDIPMFTSDSQTGHVITYFHKGYGLTVHKAKDEVWVLATINLAEGRIMEYLHAEEDGVFKLVDRRADTSVPMTDVIRRHNKFKIGQKVRI